MLTAMALMEMILMIAVTSMIPKMTELWKLVGVLVEMGLTALERSFARQEKRGVPLYWGLTMHMCLGARQRAVLLTPCPP